jgi:hypothetical protein
MPTDKNIHDQVGSYMLSRLVGDLARPAGSTKVRSFENHVCSILRDKGFRPSQPVANPLPTRQFVRDLGVADASTGGDLVFGRMIDVANAARPLNALDLAGTPRLELVGNGPVAFTRWIKESSLGGWISEGGQAGAPNLTVKQVNASPKSSYASIRVSRPLLQQASIDVEQSLLRELAAGVRATFENGFFNGTGSSSEPLGLLSNPSATVNTNAWAGATPTRAELVAQLQNYTTNYGRLDRAAWFASSNLIARLLTQEAASGTGVFNLTIEGARPTILGIRVFISEEMPDDQLLLLDPNLLRMVFWGAPAALVDRFTYDLSGDVVLFLYNDADLVATFPEQVCISKAA